MSGQKVHCMHTNIHTLVYLYTIHKMRTLLFNIFYKNANLKTATTRMLISQPTLHSRTVKLANSRNVESPHSSNNYLYVRIFIEYKIGM